MLYAFKSLRYSISCATDDGCFLGINPNFKIYVKGLSLKKVREVEQTAEDDVDLARKLFLLIFKQDLAERPHRVCCTDADGKELLNQTYLTAIRCKYSFGLAGTVRIPVCLSHFMQITFTTTITAHQRNFVPHQKLNAGRRSCQN